MAKSPRLSLIIFALLFALPNAQAQSIRVDSFYSAGVHSYRDVTILLPASYARYKKMPLLYLLHGYGGNHTDWTTMASLAKHARDFDGIIVMPSADNSWYTNSKTDTSLRYEEYIVKDLHAYVRSKYQIDTTRIGIAGLSMGGYGAVRLALRYPGMYRFAGSLSGAFASKRFTGQENVAEMVRKADTSALPYFFVAIGFNDALEGLNESNYRFVQALREKKARFEFHEAPGDHHWSVWDRDIQLLLQRMGSILGF